MFRQYRGARDKDSFISFVEEKKWQVDVISPLIFLFIYNGVWVRQICKVILTSI